MSNDKAGENPARRKPKVSWGREIRPGLAGTLVEAERRRRWTAGQHSCATAVNRRRDGIKKVIRRLEVAVGHSKVGGRKNPPIRQGMDAGGVKSQQPPNGSPRKTSIG